MNPVYMQPIFRCYSFRNTCLNPQPADQVNEWSEMRGCGAEQNPCRHLFSLRPLNMWSWRFRESSTNTSSMKQYNVGVNSLNHPGHSFPGISELCWWPLRKCVSLHGSLVMWLNASFWLFYYLERLPSLFLQVCVSSIASSLSFTLSFSPRSICASVTRQRGDSWANSHLRCCAASLLTRLSWGSGVCRLLCSLWPTQPMAGQATSQTGLSEWWARPLRCVSGALVRGGLFGLDVFIFMGTGQVSGCQRQETEVIGVGV